MQNVCKTSFSRFWVFLCCRNSFFGGEERLFGNYGLVEPDILVLVLLVSLLRSLILVGGSRMGTWPWIR